MVLSSVAAFVEIDVVRDRSRVLGVDDCLENDRRAWEGALGGPLGVLFGRFMVLLLTSEKVY